VLKEPWGLGIYMCMGEVEHSIAVHVFSFKDITEYMYFLSILITCFFANVVQY